MLLERGASQERGGGATEEAGGAGEAEAGAGNARSDRFTATTVQCSDAIFFSPLPPLGAPGARAQGEEEAEGEGAEGATEEGGKAADQIPEGGSSQGRSHAEDAAGSG